MVCGFTERGFNDYNPNFTRVLSTEQYGLYSTYLSWESLLLMITSLSLFKAMMNLYVKYDNQEHILSTVSGLTLVLTILVCYCYFIKDILAEILGLTPVLVVCMFSYFISGRNTMLVFTQTIYMIIRLY